jgi:hypothetical protein
VTTRRRGLRSRTDPPWRRVFPQRGSRHCPRSSKVACREIRDEDGLRDDRDAVRDRARARVGPVASDRCGAREARPAGGLAERGPWLSAPLGAGPPLARRPPGAVPPGLVRREVPLLLVVSGPLPARRRRPFERRRPREGAACLRRRALPAWVRRGEDPDRHGRGPGRGQERASGDPALDHLRRLRPVHDRAGADDPPGGLPLVLSRVEEDERAHPPLAPPVPRGWPGLEGPAAVLGDVLVPLIWAHSSDFSRSWTSSR